MFTGIIETIGTLTRMTPHGEDLSLEIHAPRFDFTNLASGDSIAVNGICLTLVSCADARFNADVSVETLERTTLGDWQPGTQVNLERPVTPATLLGGHLLSGHIDGVATLVTQTPEARSTRLTFTAPAELARYIAVKGSIAIDGVSLTINQVTDNTFSVNIIPHTQERTIICDYRKGTRVNLEVDLLARYLERLLDARRPAHETRSAQHQSNARDPATPRAESIEPRL